tara:strand:+ start:177 stop:365 length:189 start_codon:yes stop_codon:yes gene_type:complete
MDFYNVKKKETVSIPDSEIKAVEYKRMTKNGKEVTRYGLRAVDDDGTKLAKFCSKEIYDKIK